MIRFHRRRMTGCLDHELGAFPFRLLKDRDLRDFYNFFLPPPPLLPSNTCSLREFGNNGNVKKKIKFCCNLTHGSSTSSISPYFPPFFSPLVAKNICPLSFGKQASLSLSLDVCTPPTLAFHTPNTASPQGLCICCVT